MPEGNIITGKFGDKKVLSPSLISKYEREAVALRALLIRDGIADSISVYLNDLERMSCGDDSFKDELLNWNLDELSTDDGFAWLLGNYSKRRD